MVRNSLYGFTKSRLTTLFARLVDEGTAMDVVHLDYKKDFEMEHELDSQIGG